MHEKDIIPIEKTLKRYAVNALKEDHVREFSRKKRPFKREFLMECS